MGGSPNKSLISTGTEAADRMADVILELSFHDSTIGISAISRRLGISKAVVHRILQSLLSRGLVQVDPESREYSLGPSATAIGLRALRQMDLRKIAHDELMILRDGTQETTTLSLLAVDKRMYVDQYESPQEIKMMVELGRTYPLYAGASSRAILAFLPETLISRVMGSLIEPHTNETRLNRDDIYDRLEEVRKNGYATSRGERQAGAGSVAAPVFGGDATVIGSISVCGPLARFDAESVSRHIPLVTAAADRISIRLKQGQGA